MHIEADVSKVKWDTAGRVPLYIKLEGEFPKGKKVHLWTCEHFLTNAGTGK